MVGARQASSDRQHPHSLIFAAPFFDGCARPTLHLELAADGPRRKRRRRRRPVDRRPVAVDARRTCADHAGARSARPGEQLDRRPAVDAAGRRSLWVRVRPLHGRPCVAAPERNGLEGAKWPGSDDGQPGRFSAPSPTGALDDAEGFEPQIAPAAWSGGALPIDDGVFRPTGSQPQVLPVAAPQRAASAAQAGGPDPLAALGGAIGGQLR